MSDFNSTFSACPRCHADTHLIKCWPLLFCQKPECHAVISVSNTHQIINAKFSASFGHVNISYLENKTYFNGDLVINTIFPIDVSDNKLKTFLIFS